MKSEIIKIIGEKFTERKNANQAYSLRSYARDLNISPSTLSEILNGKKGFSQHLAFKLAEQLKLPDWEKEYFKQLIQYECSKNSNEKLKAKKKLDLFKRNNRFQIVNSKAIKSLSSWVELAILELTYVDEFKPNIKWISKKLDIPEHNVELSIERLIDSKLLDINSESGKWIDVSPFFSTTDGVSNESIRNFHKSVLNLALKKLDNHNVNSRIVKTVVLSVSEKNKESVKKILDEAINQIAALGDQKSPDCSDVICFSSQIFSLINKEISK